MLTKHKHRRALSEDEIIDSFLDKDAAKLSHKSKISRLQDSLDSYKPDYSQSNLAPAEIRGTRFKHTAIDYSRTVTPMTEDEIIEAVLNPPTRFVSNRSTICNENSGPAVQDYMRNVVNNSELKRGRMYSKIS